MNHPSRPHLPNLLVATWLVALGCTGAVGSESPQPGRTGSGGVQSGGGTVGAGGAASSTVNPTGAGGITGATAGTGGGDRGGASGVLPPLTLDSGAVVLRRLNRAEYNNTIRDLLGTTARPADNFPADQLSVEGFQTVGAVLDLSPLHTEQFETATIQLVDELFALPAASPVRQKVLLCALQAGSEPTCVRQILSAFVPRAYRRPVTATELDDLVALVSTAAAAGNSYQDALKAALQAVLLSPHFIFHVENDATPSSPAAHPLTDWELAARLSYFLWSSMPDAALFAAADAKVLNQDPTALAQQVSRMLNDPRAAALTSGFATQWLKLNQLDAQTPTATAFPEYDDALKTSALKETSLFFQSLLANNLPLETLLLADFTIGDARLATHYNLNVPTAPGFTKLSLAGSHRLGVLTQASILMANAHVDRTSPVLRGVWVMERMLCTPPPPPPANIDVPALVETRPGATLRQALEEHRTNPTCAGCHAFFDPIGLAFENFDGIGSYRTLDNRIAVDATGTFGGTAFDGAAQLGPLLARDPRFASCMAQQLLTYAVGRSFAAADGKSYVNAVARHAVAEGKGQWRSWIEMIPTTEAFRTRRGVAP